MMRFSPVVAKVTLFALLVSSLVLPAPSRAEGAQANAVSGTAPFINTWLLAGPFDGSVVADPSLSPAEGDAIGGGAWEYFDDRLYNRNLDDYQDLYGHFKVKKQQAVSDNMVAYAHVYVYSASAKTAQFKTGSSGTYEVWVNGASVGSAATAVEANKDTASYAISLNSGWNRILVKQVKTRAYFWGFYGRITDGSGNSVPGLEYSTRNGGGSLGIDTKGLAFTSNNMPTAFTEWPYVWTTSTRGTEHWRPQASKFRFYGQGGTPGYTWSISSGALPGGLTLGSDGTIDGKVNAAPGDYTFTMRVTDSTSAIATKSFTIVVKERPNKWIEQSRQIALVSAGAAYTANFDANYSADLWADRMKQQGIQAVYFESGQQSSVWWPSAYQQQPTPDYITSYMEAVKRHGIRWGMYYPAEGAGNKHYSSSGLVKDVEDLILRFGNPSQWFFDGDPFSMGNVDAMYSLVRAYSEDAVILANARPEQGDTDLKVTENVRYWDNVLGDKAPWSAPDNKVGAIDAWRHPFSETFDLWKQWHNGQVRDDWRNFAKANVIEMATGQIADFDQVVQMARGPMGSGANPSWPIDTFPVDAQNFIDMRDAYATWINPRLESLIGTNPGPLTAAAWGYSTQRDNLIYAHVLDLNAPVDKTGMPTGGTLTVSPVADTVTSVSVLNGPALSFTQNGSELTIVTSGVTIDPIDTIIKIETNKSFTGYPLTSIKASGTRVSATAVQLDVEGELNEYAGLNPDFTSVTFASSDPAVATAGPSGLIKGVGQGVATITATAVYGGVSKSDSIDVRVGAGNAIRVVDTMIGAVLRLDGKETYFGKLYHQDTSPLTVEGRGARGGLVDTSTATVVYHTDRPDVVEISPSGIVSAKVTVTGLERVAVWATVSLDGTEVTTNKVSLDVADERVLNIGKTATASSSSGAFTAAKATDGVAYPADGSDSSKWTAGSVAGAWWQVDLGSKQNISTLDVYFNHRNDAYKNVPKSVTYQVSDNGTDWTTVLSKSTNTPPEGGYSAIEPTQVTLGASGRYLRLLFEEGAKASGIDILDVTVWGKDNLNLALHATATASSQYDGRYVPGNAVDNVIGSDGVGEWAALNEAKPWIKLQWGATQTINSVVLFDRVTPGENVNSGVLTFSDGSRFPIGNIPADGNPKTVYFADKQVDWVKFEATGGTGVNNGLSEFQVYRVAVLPSLNVAPLATTTGTIAYDSRYVSGNVADDIIGLNGVGEFAAYSQPNPAVKLQWSTAQTIDKVVLYDRANLTDNVNSGTLTFSDGTTQTVTGIAAAGTGKEITFPEKTVTWVQFQATGGTGANNGLSEFQAYTPVNGKPTDYRAAWGFNNDGSDNSKNDLDATLAGGATYSSAAPKEGGLSLSVNGASGAKASSSLATTKRDNVTMSAWVKRTGSTSSHQMILSNGNTATSGYALFLNHGDSDRIAILCGGLSVLQSQATLPTGQWTHLTATRRNGTWELYINGASVAITNSGATPATPTTGTFIGNDQSNDHAFSGLIDDVRIYERALTTSEISKLAG